MYHKKKKNVVNCLTHLIEQTLKIGKLEKLHWNKIESCKKR
jgi:hypothetical protein